MKIAISQPTYLPWIGYFDLIDQVDVFVLLDDVQFEKRSWQQRNRIKTPLGLQWLTVPVISRGRREQLINQVEIETPQFSRDHCRAVEHNYRRAQFFEHYFNELSSQLSLPGGSTAGGPEHPLDRVVREGVGDRDPAGGFFQPAAIG